MERFRPDIAGHFEEEGELWCSQVQIKTIEPWVEPSMACLKFRGKTCAPPRAGSRCQPDHERLLGGSYVKLTSEVLDGKSLGLSGYVFG